jgi:hypothetical protein
VEEIRRRPKNTGGRGAHRFKLRAFSIESWVFRDKCVFRRGTPPPIFGSQRKDGATARGVSRNRWRMIQLYNARPNRLTIPRRREGCEAGRKPPRRRGAENPLPKSDPVHRCPSCPNHRRIIPGASGVEPAPSGVASDASGSPPGHPGSATATSGDEPGLSGVTPGASGSAPGPPGVVPGAAGSSFGPSGVQNARKMVKNSQPPPVSQPQGETFAKKGRKCFTAGHEPRPRILG